MLWLLKTSTKRSINNNNYQNWLLELKNHKKTSLTDLATQNEKHQNLIFIESQLIRIDFYYFTLTFNFIGHGCSKIKLTFIDFIRLETLRPGTWLLDRIGKLEWRVASKCKIIRPGCSN